jgi:hypothetical protein
MADRDPWEAARAIIKREAYTAQGRISRSRRAVLMIMAPFFAYL